MKIHVVTVSSGWILQKMAERAARAGGWSLGHEPRLDALANLYIDVQNCYFARTPALDIGYFTHLHEDSLSNLQKHWLGLDYIFHMCEKYRAIFESVYPSERMSVLHSGEPPPWARLRKPSIGVFQRGGHVGKGDPFLGSFLNKNRDIANKFRWLIIGSGWQSIPWEIASFNDEDYDKYESYYTSVDYVLIPSLWEGGPQSLIEARAMGIPVISARVGMVPEVGADYVFEPGSETGLRTVLEEIIRPLEARRASVEHITYSNFVKTVEEKVHWLSNRGG